MDFIVRCSEALPKEKITTKDTKSTKDGIRRSLQSRNRSCDRSSPTTGAKPPGIRLLTVFGFVLRFFSFVLFVSFVVVLCCREFIAGVGLDCYADAVLGGMVARLNANDRSKENGAPEPNCVARSLRSSTVHLGPVTSNVIN